MRQHVKALVAFFGGLGTWGATAAVDGFTAQELFGVCGVVATALGVYIASNDDYPVDVELDGE